MISDDPLLLFEGEHRFGKGKMTHGEIFYRVGERNLEREYLPRAFSNSTEEKRLLQAKGLIHQLDGELHRRNKHLKQGTVSSTPSALPTGWPGALVSPLTTPDPTWSPTLFLKHGEVRTDTGKWAGIPGGVPWGTRDMTLHPIGLPVSKQSQNVSWCQARARRGE